MAIFRKNLLRLTINMRQGPGEREFTRKLNQFGSVSNAELVEIPKENVAYTSDQL
jgi:hypothetical protein